MLPFLAPVLAQLVSVGIQDRTEGRYVSLEDKHYAVETNPAVGVSLGWKRGSLSLGYSASLLVSPLEDPSERDTLVYHDFAINSWYRLRRHTTVSLNVGGSYGEVNFQIASLRNPRENIVGSTSNQEPTAPDNSDPKPDASADPKSPTPNQPVGAGEPPVGNATGDVLQTVAVNRSVRYGSLRGGAQLAHELSRELTLGAYVGYVIAGALDRADQTDYPITRGYSVGANASYIYDWDARNSLTTNATTNYSWASNRNRVTSVVAGENWQHKFNKRTIGNLGAGISNVRFAGSDGLVAYSIYPTFTASLGYTRRLGRGNLALFAGIFSSPALDPWRATLDPRLGASGGLGYTHGNFSSSLTGSATVSLAPDVNDAGAFDNYAAALVTSYSVTRALSFDAGGRMIQQKYQHQTAIPLGYAVFVGITIGYYENLNGKKP